MPFERQPSQSRIEKQIKREQQDNAQGKETKLGFARSYSESAKAGDNFIKLVTRAYEKGKNYSREQARACAIKIKKNFEGTGEKPKIKKGTRVVFSNKEVRISNIGEPDKRLNLNQNESSLAYRKLEIKYLKSRSEALAETRKKLDAMDKELGLDQTPSLTELEQAEKKELELASKSESVKEKVASFRKIVNNPRALRKIYGSDKQIVTFRNPRLSRKGEYFQTIIISEGQTNSPLKKLHIGINPKKDELTLLSNKEKTTKPNSEDNLQAILKDDKNFEVNQSENIQERLDKLDS